MATPRIVSDGLALIRWAAREGVTTTSAPPELPVSMLEANVPNIGFHFDEVTHNRSQVMVPLVCRGELQSPSWLHSNSRGALAAKRENVFCQWGFPRRSLWRAETGDPQGR
jgi:hypothetical protein